MKNIKAYIFVLFVFFLSIFKVSAKDTMYSINKYKEENYKFIEESYNKSNIQDGVIVVGEYSKEKSISQIIIEKYNFEGKKIWEYTNKEEKNEEVDYLTYTYDNNKIDGYLISITNNESTEIANTKKILKIDLDGKIVFEKDLFLENSKKINKIIPIFKDNEFKGYIVTATQKKEKSSAYIINYDSNFNTVWQKEETNNYDIFYQDIIKISENNNILGYIVLEKIIEKEKIIYNLVKFDNDGNKEFIKQLPDNKTYNLQEYNNSYIIYGLTKDVKVTGGIYSYYLVNYDLNNNEVWESIGDIAINEKNSIKLFPQKEKNHINELLLMYQNNNDLSYEVIKLNTDGLFENKIKKINNEYYHINNFKQINNILYFIGNVTCPEEDNCLYNTHALLLKSDEDKVIEVKDNNIKNIFIASFIIILLIILALIFKKKKRV